MIKISKSLIVSSINNWLGYLNAATGHGSHSHPCISKDILYYSSEGLCHRLEVKPGRCQTINKYIMNIKTNDLPDECYNAVSFVFYNKQFILYFIITIILLLLFILVLFLSVKHSL